MIIIPPMKPRSTRAARERTGDSRRRSAKKAEPLRSAARAASILGQLRHQRTCAVLLQDAFAERLGIGTTDLVCGDLIYRNLGRSPGQLVTLTGLTSGAVSGVIDRLESGGYVERQPDPTDGRRVRVKPHARSAERVKRIYADLNAKLWQVCNHFSSEELSAIHCFLEQTSAVMAAEAIDIRHRSRLKRLLA